MKRDRFGEVIEDEPVLPLTTGGAPAEHVCDKGWYGEDEQGRPVACSTCKPHLAAARARVDAALHGPVARWSE